MTETILVTGGAGYVGSHACLALSQAGFKPVVYDNLSNGHAAFVQWGPLEQGDIRDGARLDAVFAAHKPIAVMHFAALIEVGESVKDPQRFYEINVGGAMSVIAAARRAGVDKFVFSSTCATFGAPVKVPMEETHPQAPLNPYGESKLMVERILLDLDRYSGFRSAIMRYFNAAGADPEGRIGERHDPETHAIPLAIRAALGLGGGFKLFGTDYDTRDGTAVRDYIHVLDLADAHVRALQRLIDGGSTEAFNLGTGQGTTVRELIDAISRACGGFEVAEAPRRGGDAPMLVGDATKAGELLDWAPSRTLDDIVSSAAAWHRKEAQTPPSERVAAG
jgi:UDP-glucose 4-epimerase